MNTKTTATRFNPLFGIAMLGALSVGVASLPAAADSFDAPQITVSFADLNVSQPRGAAALYARIRAAAHSVCAPLDGRSLGEKSSMNACVDKAVLDAVSSVGQPALTAIYSEKTGKPVVARVASVASR